MAVWRREGTLSKSERLAVLSRGTVVSNDMTVKLWRPG